MIHTLLEWLSKRTSSSAIVGSLTIVLDEYDVHTTQITVAELEDTAAYDDSHGQAAANVLDHIDQLSIHETTDPPVSSTRTDDGEASCLALTNKQGAAFLLTDDLRALPELQAVTDTQVAMVPIILKALVTRNVLTKAEAEDDHLL